MNSKGQYQQGALDFQQRPAQIQQVAPSGMDRRGDEAAMPSIAADPDGLPRGLASHRISNDFWQEFHLEWAFREANGMVPVSPAEFADMRDFADGITAYLDIEQPERPYERAKTK